MKHSDSALHLAPFLDRQFEHRFGQWLRDAVFVAESETLHVMHRMPSHFIARRSRIEYAKAVRRQLIDLTLGQALRNTDATDKRLSFPVFAFFGGRSPQEVQKTTSVAFDITSIITLHYLGLLETAIAYFDRIAIAPSTLSSLFVERQFIRIQQPSELAKAERIAGRRPCGGAQCCVG